MIFKLSNMIKNRKYQTIFLFSFFIFILCSHEYDVFKYGRFFMEEGSVFFNSAWTKSPLDALFFSYGGYLNLPVNASTLLAKWLVPLDYAPYITSTIGLLFQLLPIFFILTAQDKWLASFTTRLLATLLLLFVPETIDISFQTLHSQFHITLACALILILQTENNYQKYLRLSVIFLATLSGLLPILLLPLYGVKFLLEKNWLRLQQLIVLFTGCCIQYFFFYEHYSVRQYNFSIADYFSIFFTRCLLLPFTGYNRLTTNFMERHYILVQKGHHFFPFPFFGSILFFIFIFYCFYKYPKIRFSLFLFIYALASLAIALLGQVGGIDGFYAPRFDQRYFLIPNSLLCLVLLYFTVFLPKKGKIISYIIIVWLILIGCYNFYSINMKFYNTYIENNKWVHVLPWKKQVALWKENNNYIFTLWSHEWKMSLPITKK